MPQSGAERHQRDVPGTDVDAGAVERRGDVGSGQRQELAQQPRLARPRLTPDQDDARESGLGA
jgi:hypothetical protein